MVKNPISVYVNREVYDELSDNFAVIHRGRNGQRTEWKP